MKQRLHTTFTLFAALLLSAAWFALWILWMEPAPEQNVPAQQLPLVISTPSLTPLIEEIQKPTLFAIPDPEGFSGTFPAQKLSRKPTFKKERAQKSIYLARQPSAAPTPNQVKLIQRIELPVNELPPPGQEAKRERLELQQLQLFFSPELAARATSATKLKTQLENPPTSIRVHMTVNEDGTVAHALFGEAVEDPALLRDIRTLRFESATEKSVGVLDIRFPNRLAGDNQ